MDVRASRAELVQVKADLAAVTERVRMLEENDRRQESHLTGHDAKFLELEELIINKVTGLSSKMTSTIGDLHRQVVALGKDAAEAARQTQADLARLTVASNGQQVTFNSLNGTLVELVAYISRKQLMEHEPPGVAKPLASTPFPLSED